MIFIDIETRSECDLIFHGLRRYAEDPTTEIICMAYAFDDDPVEFWWGGKGAVFPADVIKHIKAGGLITAHNADFERHLFDWVIAPAYGFIPPKLEQWRCSMTMGLTNGYAGGLDALAVGLGLPFRKNPAGTRLIREYCAPGHLKEFKPGDADLMLQYNLSDVEVMRAAVKCLRDLTPEEWSLYHLTARTNDKGIPVDPDFAVAALGYSDELAQDANEELSRLTNGRMTGAKQRKARDEYLFPKLTEHQKTLLVVHKKGEKKFSLDQNHRALLLACEDLDYDARQLLTFINDAGSSALKKYGVIANTHVGGCVHNTLVFNGAQTGRFASRGLQIHNIRRDCFKPEAAEEAIEDVLGGYELNEPGQTLARLLRAAVKHDDGLYWVDYSSIESRVAPWLANDADGERVLDIHRAGGDLYRESAAEMAGVSVSDVDDDLRQAGKIAVLACGYAGSKNALKGMARNYGLTFTDERAQDIVSAWRRTNRWATDLWASFDEAVRNAVLNPGVPFYAGRCTLQSDGASFLWCKLPSGRLLAYPKPKFELYKTPWLEERVGVTHQIHLKPAAGEPPLRKHTRGAGVMQNVTQAVSADLLREALLKADDAGLDIRFSVHDEIVGVGTLQDGEKLDKIMLDLPPWGTGLPIATGGVTTNIRYGK